MTGDAEQVVVPAVPQQMLDNIALGLARPTERHSDTEWVDYAYNEGIDAGLEAGAPVIAEWAIREERKRILAKFDAGTTDEGGLRQQLEEVSRVFLMSLLSDDS